MGETNEMTERQILYRLVGDVESLKRDTAFVSDGQQATRQKVERIEQTLNDVNRKLDCLMNADKNTDRRLEDVEEGVADYRKTKVRLVSTFSGIGVGAGASGGVISTWLTKMFGG